MKISTIFLTFVYWLSDIAAGVFMGALVLAALLVELPVDVVGAEGLVRVLDPLTKLSIAILVVLSASFVIVIAVERQSRSSFGWWVLWVVRSAAVVALAGITLYASGELGSSKRRVLNAVAVQPREPVAPQPQPALPDTIEAAGSDTVVALIDEPVDPASAALRTELDRAVEELRATFTRWVWLQLILIAAVFFVGAIRQSAWRHAWGAATSDQDESAEGDVEPPEGPTGVADREPQV